MTNATFWFAEWAPIARTLLVGGCGYVALLLALKLTGARTLAQMNSFDFVVTIAIGASFGRVLTARDIPLAELMAAVGLLIVLQFLMTKLQIGLPGTRRILSARPVLLFRDGKFREEAMRRARVARADVESAVRSDGRSSLEGVRAIVLESNGRLSIISDRGGSAETLLNDLT